MSTLLTRNSRIRSKKTGEYINPLTSYQLRKYTETVTSNINVPIIDAETNLYYSEYILTLSNTNTTITCSEFDSEFSDFIILTLHNPHGIIVTFGTNEIISEIGTYYVIFNKNGQLVGQPIAITSTTE